jgi:dTDP-4-amino-4,6-dideoxygalactose transaminase
MRFSTTFEMTVVNQTAAILPADPRLGYLAHKAEIDSAMQRVLTAGLYILGPEVAAFEQEFANFLAAIHTVGVGSGTDALMLALRAAEVGPQDVVITVSNTAVATVAAIQSLGAEALLVDVDPETFTMDPRHLEHALDSASGQALRVKAVLPVHLFGHPAEMDGILNVARSRGLVVIEDCAQAHGAMMGDRKVGSLGDSGAFSFYPTKNLPALGDGGAVVTSDLSTLERLRLLRQYGWKERYISEIEGWNSRLDELQAAVLRVRLRYLDAENQRRRAIAALYSSQLTGSETIPPHVRRDCFHVYHQYVVRTSHREALQARLKKNHIGSSILYPVPIHLQPAYKGKIRMAPDGLPITERLCSEILSLPIYPELTNDQVECIIRVVLEQ